MKVNNIQVPLSPTTTSAREGAAAYKRADYSLAAKLFGKALDPVPVADKVVILGNRAASYYKVTSVYHRL